MEEVGGGVQAFTLATDLVIFKLEKGRRAPKKTHTTKTVFIHIPMYLFLY